MISPGQTNQKKEKTHTALMSNEKGKGTAESSEIQRIILEYFEVLYSKIVENLEAMDKFLNYMSCQN